MQPVSNRLWHRPTKPPCNGDCARCPNDEETFGPVAAIALGLDDAHLAELANASPFGLSVSIWSGSRQRALDLARRITTGAVFINAVTASDARLPFGGTKKSGYGRELAAAGVREFTNIRTYWATAQG